LARRHAVDENIGLPGRAAIHGDAGGGGLRSTRPLLAAEDARRQQREIGGDAQAGERREWEVFVFGRG
jgi:hypothetical protein